MKWRSIFILCMIICVKTIYAADQIIECDSPMGTRIDYFALNNINLANNIFHMGKDRVAGMKPKIIIHADKNITFEIGDAVEFRGETKSGNMQILMNNENQITFAGNINQAPIMATYYPKLGILIYSQQSVWPSPDLIGARAVIFYSKCQIKT